MGHLLILVSLDLQQGKIKHGLVGGWVKKVVESDIINGLLLIRKT